MTQEIILNELGFFTETTAQKIAKKLNGRSYMNFKIKYSNQAGNCTLILVVDKEYTKQKAKSLFLNVAFDKLGRN